MGVFHGEMFHGGIHHRGVWQGGIFCRGFLLLLNNLDINMFEILFQLMSLRKSDPNVLHQNQTLLIISMIATGLKLLTRLQLGLSHLGDHKFRYKFQQCIPSVFLWSGYWNNSLLHSLQQSSLSKENPLSQDKSSKCNDLKTEWFYNYKDFVIRWQ